MNFQTVSFGHQASEAERGDVEATVRTQGGSVIWRSNARAGRTYGLVRLPDGKLEAAIGTATAHDTAIIALAVYPAAAEALPFVRDALAGAGRPSGVIATSSCEGGVVVEWDPYRTAAAVVYDVVDVELARFGGGRTAELLAPLPEDLIARLAAEGLQAPEISPDRELETLVERAGLADG
ncbi:MAG TPA: hypothetical protein VFE36_14460 [Candidatus Baltobacteraceae bacterium]|nr:hypothetical protein [Candidatus Baltobacteraceae bacterium]